MRCADKSANVKIFPGKTIEMLVVSAIVLDIKQNENTD